MYSTEAPLAIRLAEPSCRPELPEILQAAVASTEKDVVIRAAAEPDPVRCSTCRARFAATGPTAYADGAPLCDHCVFEHDAQLAMVLAAVSVLRAYGAQAAAATDRRSALDLLAFARLYEAFAARHGERREPELDLS